jgi:hypothetical protein
MYPALLTLTALWMLMILEPATASIYYVDNAVSSSGDGTSWHDAWRGFEAIEWGNDGIGAGDTLYISGGQAGSIKRYHQVLTIRADGTASRRILISAAVDPGHDGTVVIDGDSTRDMAININGADFVTLSGADTSLRLQATNCTGTYSHFNAIITTVESNGLELEHLKVFDTYAGGIKIVAGDYVRLTHCIVSQPFAKACVLFGNRRSRIEVRDCRFEYHEEVDIDEPEYGDTDGINCGSFGTMIIDGCYFYGKHRVHGDGIQIYRPEGQFCGEVIVRNSIFEDWRNSAIFLEETDSLVTIYNNIFYNNQRVGIENDRNDSVRIWNNTFVDHGDSRVTSIVQGRAITISGSDLRYVDIRNNLIASMRSEGTPDCIHIGNSSVVEDYNLIHDAHEPNANTGIWLQSYNATVEEYFTAKGGRANDINAPPHFHHYAEDERVEEQDFRLTDDSPARGSGVDLSEEFDTDITGARRTVWDVGAFAYGSDALDLTATAVRDMPRRSRPGAAARHGNTASLHRNQAVTVDGRVVGPALHAPRVIVYRTGGATIRLHAQRNLKEGGRSP